MQKQIRPWTLIYTIIFGLLSVSFVYNDFSNQYPVLLSTWAAICYAMIFVGNLLYSLRRVPLSFRTPWKIVFPVLVLQFAFSGIYDSQHGKHAHNVGAGLLIAAWIISLLCFLPTFWVHFRIGFGEQANGNVA